MSTPMPDSKTPAYLAPLTEEQRILWLEQRHGFLWNRGQEILRRFHLVERELKQNKAELKQVVEELEAMRQGQLIFKPTGVYDPNAEPQGTWRRCSLEEANEALSGVKMPGEPTEES